MEALFTAFDTTGLSAGISAILTVGVAVLTLFVGYKFIKKGGNRM